MKKVLLAFIVAAVLVGAGIIAWAQQAETYSIDVTAGQEGDIDWDRIRYNGDLCLSGGLPTTCTQAQLRAIPGHESDNIFADSLSGRGNFLKKVWILDRLSTVRDERNRRDAKSFCTWWTGLSQANKDTNCAAFGLLSGCELCR